MSSHLRRCCITYIKVWSRIKKKCKFACRLYSESGVFRWLKNIKRYYDASVLMSWNFATSLLSSERSTVVAQLCVSSCIHIIPFGFYDLRVHIARVFYFACSMIAGNAKASRRGTSGELGTTLFILYQS